MQTVGELWYLVSSEFVKFSNVNEMSDIWEFLSGKFINWKAVATSTKIRMASQQADANELSE